MDPVSPIGIASFLISKKFGQLEHRKAHGYSSASCQKPFQCRYCPYGASQKGNLKTHVLCVHRMPFDNSQYPDRRFKRSRGDSDTSDDGHPRRRSSRHGLRPVQE
ncbi:hypothetical protein ANANG_G00109670 [Anguilla anguilla]|uniref:C2H2-type domain-containing protein n=1 Tax=Anguilla anguilla TaxID=7936 RepID=A0A9D3RZW1_ANGAN|nr:hypothetical protein ANANG_G00109670 [Anguilla anguilla]